MMRKFLITADWHVRGTAPVCRKDEDWIDSQRQTIQFLVDEAERHDVDRIMQLGDIHHTAVISSEALTMLMETISKVANRLCILPGNHDLPYHNYDMVKSSSLGVLLTQFQELTSLEGTWDAQPFGLETPGTSGTRFIHRLIFPDEASRPVKTAGQTAEELLEEFPEAKTIFCGDYHHSFIFEKDGRHVINPGCIGIQVADMVDYQPVYALCTVHQDGTLESCEFVPIPAPSGQVIDTSHIEVAHVRNERIQGVLEAFEASDSSTLSFRSELENDLMNEPNKEVSEIVSGLLQEIDNESK